MFNITAFAEKIDKKTPVNHNSPKQIPYLNLWLTLKVGHVFKGLCQPFFAAFQMTSFAGDALFFF